MLKSNHLSPHQDSALNRISHDFLEKKNHFISASIVPGTGLGVVTLAVIKWLSERSKNILVLTDKKILFHQILSNVIEFNYFDSIDSETHSESFKKFRIEKSEFVITTVQQITAKGRLEFNVQDFEVVIFFDMSANNQIKFIESNFREFEKYKFISISGTEISNKEWQRYFSNHSFSYSYQDALRDHVIIPFSILTMPALPQNYLADNEKSHQFLYELLDFIRYDFTGKILFVCNSVIEAEHVHQLINDMKMTKAYLLVSNVKDLNQRIIQFNDDEEECVGIVVNILTGLSINRLRNIVLMTRIKSENKINQIISLISRPNESGNTGNIWDFGANDRYFSENFPEFISQEYYQKFDFIEFNDESFNIGRAYSGKKLDAEEMESTENIDLEEATKSTRYLASPHHDKPSKIDLLGRGGLVYILKGIIGRNSNKHMIVSLFGRWGSGKSSVIEILSESFDDENTHFTIFNAWRNNHSENMTASIATKIVTSLYATKNAFGKKVLNFRWQVTNNKSDFIFYALTAFVVFFSVLVYLLSQGLIAKDEFSLGVITSIVLIPLPKLILGIYRNSFITKLKKISSKPSYNSHIGISDGIKNEINNLLKIYPKTLKPPFYQFWKKTKLSDPLKYIIVIDDLDRCSDRKIIETLEAVQLVVNLENTVVIVAIDDDVLMQAVANLYKSQRSDIDDSQAFSLARDFLGKILQVTITLDKPSLANRKYFIKKRLYPNIEANNEDEQDTNTVSMEAVKPENNIDEEFNLFEFDINYDEEDELEYDNSDDYLNDELFEFQFFQECVQVFDIANPRTMLRLHNIITISKGLYPSISNQSDQLKIYIFIAFWYEKYSISMGNDKSNLYQLIDNREFDSNDPIAKIAEAINLYELDNYELRKVIHRIKNLSLPSINSDGI